MPTIKTQNIKGEIIKEFPANSEESLFTQLKKANVMVPFACGIGACGVCTVTIKKGIEFLEEEAFGTKHLPMEGSEVLSCICGIKKDIPENAKIIIEMY